MQKNIYGESLIGIIIGVFILSIVLLGIGNLISYSNNVLETYKNSDLTYILQNNLSNAIRKIDTTSLNVSEIFYLYKNPATKQFEIFTGSGNVAYKYIDEYGNKVDDINTFQGSIYSRTLWIEMNDDSLIKTKNNQVIRASIKKLIPN